MQHQRIHDAHQEALREWLLKEGVQKVKKLNEVLKKNAVAWWDFYGGKDQLNIKD
jgi:tagatose-1,6-bisphosphate aldolase